MLSKKFLVVYYSSVKGFPYKQVFNSFFFSFTGCNQPLGLENGYITESQITFSGNAEGNEASKVKLNAAGGYCIPFRNTVMFIKNEYMTIKLSKPHRITGFVIQGYDRYHYGSRLRVYYNTTNHGFVMYDKVS